jgi:FkbM family methyltransferase
LPLFLNYSNISPGDTILIAGAGMGSEIGHFSNLVGTDGIVIAIEPDGDAFRRLSKVVSLLPVKNVNLLNCAVGKESGETLLYMPDFHTVSNTTINIGPTRMQSKKVFMQTIEMICNNLKVDQIDYLKMNIEGAEYSALMGVGKIKVNHFCISCHDFLGKQFRTREKVTSKLIREGYELFGTSEVPGKPWVGSYIYAKNQQPNT